MSAPHAAMAWTLAEVANLLTGFDTMDIVATALPPTTEMRLRNLLADTPQVPKFRSMSPGWVLNDLSSEEFAELAFLGRPDRQLPLAGPLTGGADRDRWLVRQPLAALQAADEDSPAKVDVRTLDSLFGGLTGCKMLFVGAGGHAEDLLASAGALLARHRPIIAIDLATSTWLGSVSPLEALPPLLALLGYQVLPADGPANPTRRFLVLSPDSGGLATPRHLPDREQTLLDAALVTHGVRERTSTRIAWTGRPPGISLLVEQPGETATLHLGLTCTAQDGINLFVDGRRSAPILRAGSTASRQTITHSIPCYSADGSDRLLVITLAPVRPSTTARPERLEVANLSFT